eukprot:TRINITY_DN7061_c0_g1_i1.p1 TRINITY_DN7061_c0_g1~~TRINITY_DN7061_c0_g1_i1.p1  ORF type:complete len:849 (-),score=90.58 TRINITY_DN7061_c0_g1_i1:50-2596(-)
MAYAMRTEATSCLLEPSSNGEMDLSDGLDSEIRFDGDSDNSPTAEYIDLEMTCEMTCVNNDQHVTNGKSSRLDSTSCQDSTASCSSARSPLVQSTHAEETVELGKNCYTLILVSGRCSLLLPMLAVAAGQGGLLWIVAWSSSEYFFEAGQWIVPVSDHWSVNAMKLLSILLTLFKVSAEFKDASKLYRVLSHYPLVSMTSLQRFLGSSAFLLQYVVAVVVLIMALHLILASSTPIATIGKLWVVFATLDFDNQLCNFILFVFDCENDFTWKIPLLHTRRRASGKLRPWMLLYWAPVAVSLACVCLSVWYNTCPLTALHYGIVRNTDPVRMLTSTLGLPHGCCPPQVADLPNMVNVSVPCISTGRVVQGDEAVPRVHYVVVPDGRPAPSSLQVLLGRGGDGNEGLHYGHVHAKPLQMRWWLTRHGFAAPVYDAMRENGVGGLGLYESSFPYVAEWEIHHFPLEVAARVYVVAKNPLTGALSPLPVMSSVIFRKHCPLHCQRCDSQRACTLCEQGFTLQVSRPSGVGRITSTSDSFTTTCLPCTPGCARCDTAGPGRCDPSGCLPGNGLSSRGTCLPCAGQHCLSCNENSRKATSDFDPLVPRLPCTLCPSSFALAEGGEGCIPCPIKGCSRCSALLHGCEECLSGHTLWNRGNASNIMQECLPCAAHCSRCNLLGPGKCDPEHCEQGFSLTPTGICAPCSMHCGNCSISGPDHCDAGQCRAGFGLQGGTQCTKCQVDSCDQCDQQWGKCDACHAGFGLTPDKSCEACTDACRRCTGGGLDSCAECVLGFGLEAGRCLACADQCEDCHLTGPGQCDARKCSEGWVNENVSGMGSVCVRAQRAESPWLAEK